MFLKLFANKCLSDLAGDRRSTINVKHLSITKICRKTFKNKSNKTFIFILVCSKLSYL